MLEFQQRVVDEEKELTVRLTALKSFILLSQEYAMLPADEQLRLTMQGNVMTLYQVILRERIANFHRT